MARPTTKKPAVKRKAEKTRNERRREKYKTDSTYRETTAARSRDNYREQHGVDLPTCLHMLEHDAYLSHGRVREIWLFNGRRLKEACFTIDELATVLGYAAPVIYRWKAKGLLPAPAGEAECWIQAQGRPEYKAKKMVYMGKEVREIIKVIGEHQTKVRYYREADTETREKLLREVQSIRTIFYGR